MNELKNDPMYQDLKERFDKIETKMDNIINLLSEKEKYTYPDFVKDHYNESKGDDKAVGGFEPNIQNELDERIYKESQSITGGEFSGWYNNLTPEERKSYQRIYGH